MKSSMNQPAEQKAKTNYLDPEVLSQIGPLDVVCRQVVEGIRIGMHRSPIRGLSTEFSAYRQYVPGDEVKHIDWKLYARSSRYHVKLFDAETNFITNMLLDASSSMTYKSGDISKLEYAKYLAASMAYLITDQRDSVGCCVFDGEMQNYVAPKSSKSILVDLSNEMNRVEPKPRTNIASMLHEFARRMKTRGFVILFSDLFDMTDEFIEGINHLRFKGHNVIIFHILDSHEINFPLDGMWKMIGLEGEGEIVTQPARILDTYLKELEKFINEIRSACMKCQADYVLVNTKTPIEQVISNYLLRREASVKGR